MTTADLPILYRHHLETVRARADEALARGGFDHLLVPAGTRHYHLFDDRDYPYAVNPQFKAWAPLVDIPGSWICHTPGRAPKLVYLQPFDYWHVVPEAPAGYWASHFEIVVIRTPEEAQAHLPRDASRCAILGEPQSAIGPYGAYKPNNPRAVVDYLEYHRAYKTPYEIAMMRAATARRNARSAPAPANSASTWRIARPRARTPTTCLTRTSSASTSTRPCCTTPTATGCRRASPAAS